MTQYLMALGHDIALAELDPITPQPASPGGVQNAQRDLAANGSVYETGLHIVLQWTSAGRAGTYQALLEQFNLDDFLRVAVTIYAPDFMREWHRYNGWAIRPRALNYARFARDVQIIVRDLVQLGEP